ncbi:MAG: VOC family protein [Dehalococcoidia bacterium]
MQVLPFRTLPAGTAIGLAGLTVASLERSATFYEGTLGMDRLDGSAGTVLYGVAGAPLLELVERPGAQPKPAGATGLFHVAILLPSRRDLGRLLRRILAVDYPIDGAADHLVSEAVYLADPDGNGLELYCDRPPGSWRWEDNQVRMASNPFDFEGILGEGESGPVWSGIARETRIGHVHLQVGDVDEARRFYVDTIGFDLTARWPGAVFASADGYHHHLGLNSWRSKGGPRPPANAAGLRYFTIELPDDDARRALASRLEEAGVAVVHEGGALLFGDPWGNGIVVRG